MVVAAISLGVSPATVPVHADAAKPAAAEVPLMPLAPAWTRVLGVSPQAPPAADDERLYLPLETGDLVALDMVSGATAWQASFPTRLAPGAGDGRVIVAGDGTLEGVRAADGQPLWQVPLDAPVQQAPRVRGGWVFVVLESNDLDAYAADSGKRVWRAPLNGKATTALAIEGDRLYLGVAGQGLVALDVMTGGRHWNAPLDGDTTAVLALADRVFAGTRARWLHALDPRSGRSRWKWRIGGEVLGFATYDTDIVALMLDQSMRAFRMGNGAQTWREPLAYRPFAGPIRTGSDLVVAGYGPAIRTYATADGKLRGSYTIPGSAGVEGEATFEALVAGPHLQERPGFVDDMVVLVTQRGTVHAAKRQLLPPLTPLKVVPGSPLPVPSAPAAPTPDTPTSPALPASLTPLTAVPGGPLPPPSAPSTDRPGSSKPPGPPSQPG